MQIELKERVLKFLQKIVKGVYSAMEIKEITAEAFILEMQVRMSNRNLTLETPVELQPIQATLTESQLEHYQTIRWLLDPMGPRAVGKTELMAMAFIQHSLYYGIWVRVYDHTSHPRGPEEVVERMHKIVSGMKGIRISTKKGMGNLPQDHVGERYDHRKSSSKT